MHFDEHCNECLQKLGNPWAIIHIWLDEFAGKPGIGMKHRKFRHHQAGIDEVRTRWGYEAAEAAKLHIIADLEMDQWDYRHDPIPENEEDYTKMGLF